MQKTFQIAIIYLVLGSCIGFLTHQKRFGALKTVKNTQSHEVCMSEVELGSVGSEKIAEILSQSLPSITRFSGKTVVIKYGGHAMTEPHLKDLFAKDIVLLKKCGVNPVVVHGGGPQIASMLKKLQIESRFVEGLRVTDKDTVEVAEMVLSGSINKEIVNCIKRAGGRAVGISGKDDDLILAEKIEKVITNPETGVSQSVDLGLVGEPTKINVQLIHDLQNAGLIPVIAPVGVTKDGQTLNINADTSAGAIAGALGASLLLLLTDVKGVLSKKGELLKELTMSDVIALKNDGTITGGMIPKLATATGAVEAGAQAAVILDGRVPHAVLVELCTIGGSGTSIKADTAL